VLRLLVSEKLMSRRRLFLFIGIGRSSVPLDTCDSTVSGSICTKGSNEVGILGNAFGTISGAAHPVLSSTEVELSGDVGGDFGIMPLISRILGFASDSYHPHFSQTSMPLVAATQLLD
jgi:hypothetical protein